MLIVCVVLATLCGRVWADDFQPPADGVVSEQKFKTFMAAADDLGKAMPALQQQVNDAPTPAAQTAATDAINQKATEYAAAHKLSRAEFTWIGDQALDAYQAVLGIDQYLDQKTKELDAQVQANDTKFAAAKEKLVTYSAAQKDGRRVMTDGEKAATTQAAATDKDASTLQLKEDGDALASANAAIQIHTQEQQAAEVAMKSAPAGLDAVAKASYIVQKNDEVEKARAAVDDARRMATDAQTDIDQDNQHLADDAAHLAHPDMPANPTEKADIDQINADAVTAAQKDLDDSTKFAAGVGDLKTKIAADAQSMAKDIPDANLALIRAHRDEYAKVLDALGIPVKPDTLEPPAGTPAPDAAAPDAGAPDAGPTPQPMPQQ
jgi:hypothetical protein